MEAIDKIEIPNPHRGFNIINFEKNHGIIKDNDSSNDYKNYISEAKEKLNINISFIYVDIIPEKQYKYKHKITGELFDKAVWENGECVAPSSLEDAIYTGKNNIYLYIITHEDILSFVLKDMWEKEKQLTNLFLSYCDKNSLLNLENISYISLNYNCISEWEKQEFLNKNIEKINEHIKCKYPEISLISYSNHGISENNNKTTITGHYTNSCDAQKYHHNKSLEIKKCIFEYIKMINSEIYSSLENMPFFFYGDDGRGNQRDSILLLAE